jgi:hypothetical protein
VLGRYEELYALVEGELSRAKDTAALNTALRSLRSAATVDWVDRRGAIDGRAAAEATNLAAGFRERRGR